MRCLNYSRFESFHKNEWPCCILHSISRQRSIILKWSYLGKQQPSQKCDNIFFSEKPSRGPSPPYSTDEFSHQMLWKMQCSHSGSTECPKRFMQFCWTTFIALTSFVSKEKCISGFAHVIDLDLNALSLFYFFLESRFLNFDQDIEDQPSPTFHSLPRAYKRRKELVFCKGAIGG